MHQHLLERTMVGVVSLWFVMTTSEPDGNHNVIQPVGPKMCDHLCSRRMGCSGYWYAPLHLSCLLIIEKITSGRQSLEESNYHKVSKIYQAKRNLACLRNSKIFYTRKNIPKCRRSQLKPCRQMIQKFTRLLMLPCSWKSDQGRQLYLCNKSVSPYPYIRTSHSSAVAYISSTRKLVISNGNLLFLMTLDHTDRTIISNVTPFTAITVEEDHQLVFLTSVVNNTIHVMTTEGKDVKPITTVPGNPGQVAADSQRQVIYVAVGRQHIARYTYKGKLEGIVVKGLIHSQLYVNSNRNVLYYMGGGKKWNFFKMFLANGTKFTIPSPVEPLTFYVYSNTLYFLPKNKLNQRRLHVLSDSGRDIATIKTGFGHFVNNILFCVIS